MKTRLIASKSEARRLIIQGGIEVDGRKESDPNRRDFVQANNSAV